MLSILNYIVIPAICGLLAVGAAAVCVRDKDRQKAMRFRILIAVCSSVLTFTVLHMVILLVFAAYATPFPPLAVAAISVCFIAALLIPKTDPLRQMRPRLCLFLRRIGAVAAVCLLLETFVFHFASVTTSFRQAEIPVTETSLDDTLYLENDTVVINKSGSLTVTDKIEGMSALGLHFTSADASVHLTVHVKDDNFSAESIKVIERNIRVGDEQVYLPINTYGTVHEIQLTFSDATESLTLHKIYAANALPFSFNSLRFFTMLLVLIVGFAVFYGRLYNRTYEREKRSHKLLVFAALAVCLSVSVALIAPLYPLSESSIDYPFENAGSRDAYVQQFDAFQKGQLHLDIEPNETLLALENPYDKSLRSDPEHPVYYQWDRAFYEGKYYSYFGIAPLMLYYPYYAAAGALPDIAFACGVFAIAAQVFLFALVLRLVKMFCGKVNLILLLLGLIATTAVSGIWWYQATASDYTLPLLSGLCFLFFTIWTGLCGYSSSHRFVQPLMLALCGVGVCLTAASRPTLVLGALILAPAFLHIVFRKDYSAKHKLISAAAFLVPTLIGAIGLMLYNYARFGSPFEFGATYQLTVSDIHANTLTLSLLPMAIYHYILQPMSVHGNFPFLRPQFTLLQNYGRYMYVETSVGVLAFPHLLGAAIGLPAICKRAKKSPVKFAMLVLAPILALVAAFCDMCLGGVNLRYVADVIPVFAIAAVPVCLELYHRIGRFPRVNSRHFPLFVGAFAASILMSVCILLYCSTGGAVKEHYPQLLPYLEDTFAFWR